MDEIKTFIKNLKQERRLETFDEAATKQAVVLRLLSLLGWDSFNVDEVTPEYSVSSQRIDYSLRIHHTNKVFIEVKKINEDLEKHQEQLLNYSFQEGVKLAVLTNGISWWFYLPLTEGSWEQRKFYTIDILQQESEDISKKFIDFLSKDKIETGEAIEYAEKIYHNQQKREIARRSLPKAWNRLIEEPDELLVELLGETAERLSGYKTDLEVVANFLKDNEDRLQIPVSKPRLKTRKKKSKERDELKKQGPEKDYTGQNIVGFSLLNNRYNVSSWKEFLVKISEILYQKNSKDFERVLELRGRKRPYFSRNPNELRAPASIGKSGIYAETNLSANDKVKRAYQMLSLLNYQQDNLAIYISK
jgi:predicted type IV restriction endonuclease